MNTFNTKPTVPSNWDVFCYSGKTKEVTFYVMKDRIGNLTEQILIVKTSWDCFVSEKISERQKHSVGPKKCDPTSPRKTTFEIHRIAR